MDAYLAKLGYSGPLTPRYELLSELHFLHQQKIPFENLDVLLDKIPALDETSLMHKVVHSPRGGYCFELNLAFAHLLRKLGFEVEPRLGRVLMLNPDATQVPRTHVWLLVRLEGESYLADVGFGAGSVLRPTKLQAGAPFRQDHETYQLVNIPGPQGLTLLREHRGKMLPLYWLDPAPVYPIDLVQSNFWVATYPGSRFRQGLTATLLKNGERVSQSDLAGAQDPQELAAQLKMKFGIEGLSQAEWKQLFERLRALQA